MPTSETPISTPLDEQASKSAGQSGESQSSVNSGADGKGPSFVGSRYQGLDHTDLLHAIEELEESRNWASLREKLWIALIIHMLIAWYLFYGAKYIHLQQVRVVNPMQLSKQEKKDMTYLQMPPDLLKRKPKPTNVISNQNHVAESPHPSQERKTLRELEAMRRAGPPKLTAPQQRAQRARPQEMPQGAPKAPQRQQQMAERQPPKPPAQPLPENNQAKLEAPAPKPKINFRASMGSSNPTEQLQREMRQAMQGAGQYSGDNGMNAPSVHPGEQGAVDILSDTEGVDFGPYIQRVIQDTKRAWYPLIPEEAQEPIEKQGEVFIEFQINRDGSVSGMTLVGPSGDVALDRAAWGGITGASPYPPLPQAYRGKNLRLRFGFFYNIPPGQGQQP
jgi:TonB family protein